jgi:predicted phosphohydrolase
MTDKKITIQVYSDLHIELWNKLPELPVKAEYLFLAGDISQLNNPFFYPFLDYCSSRWKKVFYTPGNHEFYSKKLNLHALEFEYKYRIENKYKNVFYVNNNFVELDENINVYGTTFWTISTFKRTCEAKKLINDYHNISYFNNTTNKEVDLDITYVNKMSDESFIKLQKYLIDNTKKTIVMTHFPPIRSGTSDPSYLSENRIVNSYFAWPDDTLSKFKLSNVLCWISGHTHWSYDIIKENVRLISNQLGYKSEYGTTGINENGLYELSYDD